MIRQKPTKKVEINFPTEPRKKKFVPIQKLMLAAQAKIGKSSVSMQLPKSFLIDLESGAERFEGMSINLETIRQSMEEVLKQAVTPLKAYFELVKQLKEAIRKKEVSYDFIILDNSTRLERLAKDYALLKYKATNMGKSFSGNDIYTLPNGAGYGLVREAFIELYYMLYGTYNKALILLSHIAYKSINLDGKEISVKDIQLSGKLKNIIAADMDAIGFMSRDESGLKNVISFVHESDAVALGSRAPHVADRSFVLSEGKDGVITKTNWDLIFPTLKN